MKHGVLLIMARAPRLGAVKTRLARDIGVLKAWRFYRSTLFATARRLGFRTPWQTRLQITPDRDAAAGRQWPGAAGVMCQGTGDIGHRMERGLTAFPRGTPVVLIGSDIPGVTQDLVREAFDALGHADVVFGPAQDGGYWLVGFANRRTIRRPFAKVRWSSPHALTDTEANMARRRITYIEKLSDVDDGASYRETLRR